MGNASPVGRRPQQERIDELAEAGLFYVSEQRQISVTRERLEKIMGGLQEADDIELERAKARVVRAKEELRDASTDLERCEEIHAQKAEIRNEMLALDLMADRATDDAEKAIAANGHRAGAAYIHPDLLAPKPMVDAQKRHRIDVSPSEAQTL